MVFVSVRVVRLSLTARSHLLCVLTNRIALSSFRIPLPHPFHSNLRCAAWRAVPIRSRPCGLTSDRVPPCSPPLASGGACIAPMEREPRPPIPPLAQAEATLRLVHPGASVLSHVVELLSQCLDVSPHVSLGSAARSGSLRLLDRVASRVIDDKQVDDTLRDHWFARALDAAIKANDLAMAKRIHTFHPEPLVVWSLKVALSSGSLELVQWVVENRHDLLCCPPGLANLCLACLQAAVSDAGEITKIDTLRVVQWLLEQGISPLALSRYTVMPIMAALASCVELTKWFHEAGLLTKDIAHKVLEKAAWRTTTESMEVIKYLAESGCKLSEHDVKLALIRASLQPGTEAVVERMITSRMCRSFRYMFEYNSARPGGPKFIQWDVELLTPGDRNIYASYNEGARWLCRHFRSIQAPVLGIITDCEEVWLDHLVWMPANCHGSWSTDVIDRAASRGFLRVVQWLHANRSEGCTTTAMNSAASNGHLHVVKWLHANRHEGCTRRAMDGAAQGGHLDVVEWLHANRREGCTVAAMEQAAAKGHLRIVQWLHANRYESDSVTAMLAAAASGQLEVLVWLHEHSDEVCTSCVLQKLLRTVSYRFVGGLFDTSWPVLDTCRWLLRHSHESRCDGMCLGPQDDSPSTLLRGAVTAADVRLLEHLYSHHREIFTRDREQLSKLLGVTEHWRLLQWAHLRVPDEVDWRQARFAAIRQPKTGVIDWFDRTVK